MARWTSGPQRQRSGFKLEGLFNARKSDQLFSPVLLDIGGSAGTIRGFRDLRTIKPFNPFGVGQRGSSRQCSRLSPPTQAWRIRKVMTEVGNRDNIQDVKTWRIAGGFDGELNLFGREWKLGTSTASIPRTRSTPRR